MHPFDELVSLLAHLREVCPWDKEQTHQSLLPYLLEESYELLVAIENGDPSAAKDELGDVLLQVVFHSQLYAETEDFDAREVLRHLIDKLIYRHRFILDGELGELTAGDAQRLWQRAKTTQTPQFFKDKAGSALMKAEAVGEQAATVGFDFDDWQAALSKVYEELGELKAVLAGDGDQKAMVDELGDCFFALTNLARQLQVNSELATLLAVQKFQRRFLYVARCLDDQGVDRPDAQLLEQLWQQAKQ